MAYASKKQGWFGFRAQGDYVTAAADGATSDWSMLAIGGEIDVAPNEATIDLDVLSGQAGVEGDVVPGSQHGGTLKFSGTFRSQASPYTASGGPTASPEFTLLADFFGSSHAGTFVSGDAVAAGSDANTIVTTGGTYAPGDAYGFGASDSAVDIIAWIVSQTGQTLDLLEDAGSVVETSDDCYAMITAYASTAQPTPKTFRRSYDNAAFDFRYVGCMPRKCTLTMSPSGVVGYEMEYAWTKLVRASAGGSATVPDLMTIPILIGDNGGRLMIDGAANADGTASTADVTEGVISATLEITREHTSVEAHSALQGVADVILDDPRFQLTIQMPVQSSEIAGNESQWVSWYEGQTSKSVTIYGGLTAGRLMAFAFPAAKCVKRPTEITVGTSLWGHELVIAPAKYSSDGSSSNAGNSAARFAIG